MKPHTQTRRSQRRQQHNEAEKELLALERELESLNNILLNTPELPLNKPYQRGWIRYFILTDQAKTRPDYNNLKELLPSIENRQFSRNREFTKTHYSLSHIASKKKKKKNIHTIPSYHPRTAIQQIPSLKLLHYFERPGNYIVSGVEELLDLIRRKWNGKLSFRYPHLLKSYVEPNIITHQKVLFPEVEKRLQEIDEIFESCNGWEKLHNLHGRRGYKWYTQNDRNALRRKIDKKEIKQILEEGVDDSTPFSLLIVLFHTFRGYYSPIARRP